MSSFLYLITGLQLQCISPVNTKERPYFTFAVITHKKTHQNSERSLTIASAVIDSLIHRFSSKRWPTIIQAHRSATNKLTDTTDLESEVPNLSTVVDKTARLKIPIILTHKIPLQLQQNFSN